MGTELIQTLGTLDAEFLVVLDTARLVPDRLGRALAGEGDAVKQNFEASQLASFRAMVERRLGLRFDDSKLEELTDVLRRRMKESNSADVESYLCLLGTSLPELREVVGHLTIPETYFFRIPDHFRVFQEVVLPERVRAKRSARQLSILSAGCASGEEPYTLAMLMQGRTDWRAGRHPYTGST